MQTLPLYERVKWGCRRGMLELDLIFEPYVLKRYPTAPAVEQALFVEFLNEADQDLFDWLLKKKPTASPRFAEMVNILLQHD